MLFKNSARTDADQLQNKEALTLREKCLLSLLLGDPLTKDKMGLLMEGIDFEKASQNYLLMLSRVGYMQGWDLFPKEIVPRLQGIHRHAQVYNTIRTPWLIEKIHTLLQAHVPVMLIKGLAMRFYYDVGAPRRMSDYDIAVPESEYSRAMSLLQKDGEICKDLTSPHHGQIIGDYRVIEVHRWIFKHHGEKDTDIWEKAIKFDFYGQEVLVPCPEDMFIHQLDNRSRDISTHTFPDRRINWLYDCYKLLETSGTKLDLARIAIRAKQFNVENSTRRMLLIFADTFSDIITVEDVEKVLPSTPSYERWIKRENIYQNICTEQKRYHYEPQGPLTPLRICRVLKRQYAGYRFERLERPYRSFLQYLLGVHKVESIMGLFRKYGARLCLLGGKPKGGTA